MSFRTGSYGWIGAGVGLAVGTLIGVLWANAIDVDDNGLNNISGQLAAAFLVPLGCTITGGIVGLNIVKYDNYYFDKNENEKTDKIKRILKVQR